MERSQVGAYETAILTATSAEQLLGWLQANNYALPDNLEPLLESYLAPGMHFVALRLANDEPRGELEPLGLRYPGATPAVPIRLTAVAATDDMPLILYILGEHRAVPLNYLHVQLNPLGYSWWGRNPQFEDRVKAAADEAGGRAFVTAYANRPLLQILWAPGMFPTKGLEAITDPLIWIGELQSRGFAGTDTLLQVLTAHLPPPDGVDPAALYACPKCYPEVWADLANVFDPVAATADLETFIVEPRRTAQAHLDANPYVTRLQTTLSPHEMTVDPHFGFNPDLPTVANVPVGRLKTTCKLDQRPREGARTFALPGGYVVPLPPEGEMRTRDDAWLEERIHHVGMNRRAAVRERPRGGDRRLLRTNCPGSSTPTLGRSSPKRLKLRPTAAPAKRKVAVGVAPGVLWGHRGGLRCGRCPCCGASVDAHHSAVLEPKGS